MKMNVTSKKYAVVKRYRIFKPDVVEEFDNNEDAQQFAKLMHKANPDTQFDVYEHCEVELDDVYERKQDLIDFK